MALEGVSKRFGAARVLRKVDASFPAGAVTLVIGGNGAGKSTLLKIMAGLSRPSSGRLARGAGADGGEARLGYVGHATFLYPGLTALENLAFWRTAHRLPLDGAALLALLARVGLAAHAHERARVFSRGMAQRLNLARVLMLAPDILLLDEPMTGLDAPSRELLRREIAAARAAGACVALVSHDLEGDGPLADRVLALASGAVAYEGPAAAFFARAGEGPCCA
ncbi:MAG: ABC transporter ATP-binding protein [Desulfovibrio sp.]|nr:ABC transporter ATP-binding protein [Desulfovibrio sp.]